GLAEAQDLAANPRQLRHTQILVTFDDGYRDNHDVALPILRSHGVPAAFFLITGFVGTQHVSWWDQIAFMLRRTRRTVLNLDFPCPVSFDLLSRPRERVIQEVLRIYKGRDTAEPERLISQIEAACDVPRPRSEPKRLFMNWDEARALL